MHAASARCTNVSTLYQITKTDASGGLQLNLSAQQRLDLNLSSAFVELAISTARMLGNEGEHLLKKARGSYAPYRIRNRTGSAIHVWSDVDGSDSSKDFPAIKIAHGENLDWRFDDWKTMREVSSYIRLLIFYLCDLPSSACFLIWSELHWHPVRRQNMGINP